jgi:hypothetical protein
LPYTLFACSTGLCQREKFVIAQVLFSYGILAVDSKAPSSE